MILNHVILAALWIIYCVLHSVMASEGIKKKLRRKMKNYKWYRLWYTLFAFVFLVVIVDYQVMMPTIELFNRSYFSFILGFVVSFAGSVLMLVCIQKYFMSLSGLRSLIVENFSNQLQVTGVHKYVRHPLYLGTFLFIWGLFLLLPFLSLCIANVVITLYTLIGIELEEQKLVLEFGEDYRQYQREVPKIIPSFKFKREH
jgi:protein-S-isoprenylcysteine O-methyltransferase Ste14